METAYSVDPQESTLNGLLRRGAPLQEEARLARGPQIPATREPAVSEMGLGEPIGRAIPDKPCTGG